MAVLPDTDRLRIWRGLMRLWSTSTEAVTGLVKPDVRAAVDAADTWADNNTASYNSALPEPFRSNATQSQKALVLVGVILMRYGLTFLKRVFGEVD